MADYSRPKEGFRYQNGGVKLNSVPDALPPNKYPALQNVRTVSDNSFRTRPGMAQSFTTGGSAVTDLRAYATLGSDDRPRFLARDASDRIWLDTGVQVGSMASSGGHPLGASMLPFRPDESPNPYMYVATAQDYQKFSAPSASNAVTQQAAGIAEPQTAPDASVSQFFTATMGEPSGGSYTTGGTASAFTVGNRITDSVQGVFSDPTGSGMTTVQVTGGSNLAAGVYLSGSVVAYFWPRLSNEKGAFGRYYPLSTASASATSSGTSLLFNPPQYNGTTNPNVQPIEWASVNASGTITGYFQPWSGATQDWDMVVVASLFVPAPGSYTITINHDDGIVFAISGASLVSGNRTDPFFNHTQTAVNGYQFTNGGVAGTNESGPGGGAAWDETFVVSFSAAGAYPIEIDYSSWVDNQSLCVYNGASGIFKQATGIGSYQRGMEVVIHGEVFTVQDVFPPIPPSVPISAIQYFSGTTGKCVVVPSVLGSGPGIDDTSIYEEALVASLRRGALVQIGSEVCYVWDVETGPDGTVCFTTSTAGAHTTSDTLKGAPGIQLFLPGAAVGQAISSADAQFSVSAGIGTLTSPQTVNPFAVATAQPQDYLHLSLNIDNLDNLVEAKILLDVGDSSFDQNFYFKAIRPNDIALGVSNGLTQLGVAQIVAQRAEIDEEQAAETANQGPTSSSAQSVTGTSQWSEVSFALTELTRVGNDQSRTLENFNSMRLLINASGPLNVAFNSVYVQGGYSPDVGPSGAPYLYRVRPRSSVTGAKGNPSPATRYGINPRRQQATVYLPSAAYDPQIDTWDVFRYGGSVTSWRYIGQAPSTSATFFDNYSDASALAGDALEFDNYQPWPSIDLPLNVTATAVCGTIAQVTISGATNALRYLPGNFVKIGGTNVYTLQTRPTLISGSNYLFQFVENAGAQSNVPLAIYEPALAQQRLPYMWGPDANGTVFACGDSLRPGFVYESKANAPDSAPDKYNQEVVPSSEPLLGGEIMDGVSYVASTERWWRMYFQPNGIDRYSFVQQPVARGLAAPFGHCTDGASISWWAKDGIWDTAEGSLTDADLYNLFPHEGVAGESITYGSVTYQPPDYSRAGSFRLETGNGFLYATYQDSSGVYHTLVYDRKRKAWSLDAYGTAVSTVYHPEQQEGTVQTSTALYGMLMYGTTNGIVAQQQDRHNDLSTPISCVVATMEWDGGDVRAGEQWGDLWLDCTPVTSNLQVTPMAFGNPLGPAATVPQSSTRQQYAISLGGGLLSDFLGLMATWTDDFTVISSPTKLHVWQPSFLPKPETIVDRFTDWYQTGDGDTAAPAAWWQGFILHCDTFNTVKGLAVRDADTLTTHAFTPVVQHNGEQSKAYSFNTPFIAHLVRIEPTDSIPWRFFDVEWISQPTPEAAETWQTQGTSFELNGYSHIQRVVIAYTAVQPVTLTITAFDGTSPSPVTLPATGGAYQKQLVVLTFNKGQLYFFKSLSASPHQIYWNDCEVLVGNWGRSSGYLNYKQLGGVRGDRAAV